MVQVTRTDIQLIYKEGTQSWTVSIDGRTHCDLTSIAAGELLEYTMMVTEQTQSTVCDFGGDGEWAGKTQVAFRLPN